MKKLVLSLMAAGFAATSFAQGGCAGGILLYGTGTYSNTHGSNTTKFSNANSNTIDEPRMLNWEVSPGLGFNISDNLTIGVDFRYTGSKTTWDRKDPSIYGNAGPHINGQQAFPTAYGEDQVKTFDYAIGPFVRYTKHVGEHFFAYGQFSAHYLRGQQATRTVTAMVGGNSFTRDDKYKGVDASFMPAVGVNLSKSVGLTFGVGGIAYQYAKIDYSTQGYTAGTEYEGKRNDFVVTFGRQFNIGLQKNFGCHKMRHTHAEPMDETRHMDTSDDSTDENNDGGRKRRRNRKNDDE